MNFYRKNGFFEKQEKIYQPNEASFFCHPEGGFATEGSRDSSPQTAQNDTRREGFLYVGQLEPHKGIMFLLDVFEKLNNEQGLALLIVGDGSLMPEVKKRAEGNPNIIVHGRVAREKLPEFYARAKATIFPSLVYENAPMVIAESLSCGTPVIASRLGGAPELIREGENGATFTPGDAADLAEKIKIYS